MIITARTRFFLLLLFFPSALNCMEKTQLINHLSAMPPDAAQYFWVEHLSDFQHKAGLALTSTENFVILQNLPGYKKMADKAIHKKRKLLLLNRNVEENASFAPLLERCIDSISHDKENKRNSWRNTASYIYHVTWNSTSTAYVTAWTYGYNQRALLHGSISG